MDTTIQTRLADQFTGRALAVFLELSHAINDMGRPFYGFNDAAYDLTLKGRLSPEDNLAVLTAVRQVGWPEETHEVAQMRAAMVLAKRYATGAAELHAAAACPTVQATLRLCR